MIEQLRALANDSYTAMPDRDGNIPSLAARAYKLEQALLEACNTIEGLVGAIESSNKTIESYISILDDRTWVETSLLTASLEFNKSVLEKVAK